ncbi:major facilitator superfamily domain-containing protein [Lactifluus volemus]|nr:major facilitator superfamily domain-containing protein [Lactifluus volemus]
MACNGDVPPGDEETPLLPSQLAFKKPPTPVPWAQVLILLFLQLAEPLTSQVIYPFTPEFVRNVGITHGDESRVGYYVGLIALTTLHWSRLSGVVGRLFGLSLSMYTFGLSTTYWGAVFSRSINGALNGNSGVIKSIVAEITDPTSLPQVYAYMPAAWSTGSTVGPMIGGLLSRPADHFPNTFGNSQFLKKYPYFFPCAVPATFSALAWVMTYAFLRETVPSPVTLRSLLKRQQRPSSAEIPESDNAERPYPLRRLMTRRVVVLAVINYGTLSLVDISYRAIQPLFFSTPVNKILACSGILNIVFQFTCFARAHALWGTKSFFYVLFPVMNALARAYGVGRVVYSAVAFKLLLVVVVYFHLYFCCIPNRASLGATNGLAQLLVSIMRAIGPAISTSLFSLSLAEGYLGGGLVYTVLLAISLVAIAFGTTLPRQVWQS